MRSPLFRIIVATSLWIPAAMGAEANGHESVSKSDFEKGKVTFNFNIRRPTRLPLQLCDPKDVRRPIGDKDRSRIVKIKAVFENKSLDGTGFWISERCIITAAHNIFDDVKGQFAKSATIHFKGQKIVGTEMFVVRGFINSGNGIFDYGCLQIATKPNGVEPMPYGDDESQNAIQIPGFPDGKDKAVLSDAQVQKRGEGTISSRGAQTTEGQSGSPMRSLANAALGIHTGGRCDGNVPINEGVKIAGPVKENLDKWK